MTQLILACALISILVSWLTTKVLVKLYLVTINEYINGVMTHMKNTIDDIVNQLRVTADRKQDGKETLK